MKLTYSFLLVAWIAGHSYSQTTISGKIFGVDASNLDSVQIMLKDGTGDTTYCHALISREGSFRLSSSEVGALQLDVICPGFKSTQAALLLDRPFTDSVEITLSHLSENMEDSRIAFHDSTSVPVRFALLHMKSNCLYARYSQARAKFLATKGDYKDFKVDWTVDARAIANELQRQREPILRHELIVQYLLVEVFSHQSTSRDSIKKWIQEIPPDSPVWLYHYNTQLSAITYASHPRGLAYVDDIIAKHPSRYLRAMMLYRRATRSLSNSDTAIFTQTLSELTRNYADTKWVAETRALIEQKLKIGDAVPAFNWRSIDDTLRVISREKMLGKVYLIDFWGTWCIPCIGEMPYLHKAYERFKGKGFTIVSVAFDRTVNIVEGFRKGQWRMPWLNAFVGEDLHGTSVSPFGLPGVPYGLLIDSKGIIVATGDALRGEALEPTIEQHIGK